MNTHHISGPIGMLATSNDSIVDYFVEAVASENTDRGRMVLIEGLGYLVLAGKAAVDSAELVVLDGAVSRMRDHGQGTEGMVRRMRWKMEENREVVRR
jgi:hypothetical protein